MWQPIWRRRRGSLFDGGVRLAEDVSVGGQRAGGRRVRAAQELVGNTASLSKNNKKRFRDTHNDNDISLAKPRNWRYVERVIDISEMEIFINYHFCQL